MDIMDLVLLVILDSQNRNISIGRTLLQKKIFFMGELLRKPIHFFPHYYGPYSREVANSVDSLVSADIIKESIESIPTYQTRWGESTRYIYQVIDKNEIESFLAEKLGHELSKINKNLSRLNSVPGSDDYKSLSIAAKVLQILKEKKRVRVKDFSIEAKKLGWELTNSDIKKAINFLTELKLLSLN